jgi:DNA-directed RNA polymerase specialized sigma24 family protein
MKAASTLHRRGRLKRHGKWRRLALEDVATIGTAPLNSDLLALDIALTRLQEREPEKARVVEMRFFAGMTTEEIAEVLGVAPRTVRRYWVYSQARLYKELTSGPEVQ